MILMIVIIICALGRPKKGNTVAPFMSTKLGGERLVQSSSWYQTVDSFLILVTEFRHEPSGNRNDDEDWFEGKKWCLQVDTIGHSTNFIFNIWLPSRWFFASTKIINWLPYGDISGSQESTGLLGVWLRFARLTPSSWTVNRNLVAIHIQRKQIRPAGEKIEIMLVPAGFQRFALWCAPSFCTSLSFFFFRCISIS